MGSKPALFWVGEARSLEKWLYSYLYEPYYMNYSFSDLQFLVGATWDMNFYHTAFKGTHAFHQGQLENYNCLRLPVPFPNELHFGSPCTTGPRTSIGCTIRDPNNSWIISLSGVKGGHGSSLLSLASSLIHRKILIYAQMSSNLGSAYVARVLEYYP